MTRWRRWVIPLITLAAVVAVTIVIPVTDAEPTVQAAPTTTTAAPNPGPGPGVSDAEIVLGVLAVTSGDAQDAGRRVLAGHDAYWGTHSRIGDRAIVLNTQDGALDPATSATAYRIMEDDIAMVSSAAGPASIASEAGAVGLLVIADRTLDLWSQVATVLPDAGLAAPADEVNHAVLWAFGGGAVARATTDSIGAVVTGDVVGSECLRGLDRAALLLDAGVAVVVISDAESPNAAAAVESLQGAGATVAVVCVSPSFLASFDSAASAAGYEPAILATSGSYDAALGSILTGEVYVTTAMPPWESDEPGVADMRRSANAAGIGTDQIDEAFYLGYTQAATAHAILLAADAAGGVGREGFLDVLVEGVEVDLQMGGVPVLIGLDADVRVPTVATGIYRPVPTTERVFGLEPVAEPFVPPSSG